MAKELATSTPSYPAISKELAKEFDRTSDNLDELLNMGNQGLSAALELLIATEATPRTVESFSTLLKTIADLNLRALDVRKAKSELSNHSGVVAGAKFDKPQVVTNTQYVFNGSTDELSKMVAEIGATKTPKK